MQVTTGSATQVGRARLVNQDSVFTRCSRAAPSPWAIAAVADGMGGLADGEDASALAVEALTRHLAATCPPALTPQHLHEAFLAAHEQVWAASQSRRCRMGTTLVAAVVLGNEALLANVGDSRCYLVANGAIECLTSDHSLLRGEHQDGGLTDDELRQSLAANVITRCVGADEAPPLVDLWRLPLTGSGSLILCSDGIHRSVRPETILEALQANSPQEAAEALVREAVRAGAADDVSVAVLRYGP